MIGVLGLEDGTRLEGRGFGSPGIISGEIVFTTIMSGYEEALTDPSYNGQLLMFTYPLQGNYGVSGDNFQSERIWPRAMVCKEIWDSPRHYRSAMSVGRFLEDQGTPGIYGIDTRMLTIKIRELGAMRAALAVGDESRVLKADVVQMARDQPSISSIDLLSEVTCKRPYHIAGTGPRLTMIDLGIKKHILKSLSARGFDIHVLPAHSPISDIEATRPDGLFLSNGPGDPERATKAIEAVRHFAGEMPIFGICLGHQIISLAMGCRTFKLKFGHHGGNQPVKDLESGIVYITSQNHNFAVVPESVEGTGIEITQKNANDGTVEGMRNRDLDMLAVQYHPEAHPGPLCTEDPFFGEVLQIMSSRCKVPAGGR
ncbi:MAG: GMP synthase (glutamine-hydrolyzing) subunit A [Methanosaeta sp. PtaB.Bin039]|nr:MAG: GMP synthase (glutamine-hydrolyzing) subunit A [Methanosaeta sp. PtaB.Bin039]OPY44503.1 MAG: GMP synthase (glutamine-hydrolyzing) subunit A [Methanosaeta sp. PtaU1.Bin028]HOT07833.1 glutamine-hydrolyzing carbamoyl-phosphate synthase small subunit [Methanotrichaceae archaeon]HQF15901.1 glutamine-hydrolyzing carbamoyl-phosphate synthase small subunit [Methanotrichaceae archaeon]HQI90751.1 glutamine-hydrolyzing carbamoyl-phosphate synthase small subunit [Methanotrichaceae archaeon]